MTTAVTTNANSDPYTRGWFSVTHTLEVEGYPEARAVYDESVHRARLVFANEALARQAVDALDAASDVDNETLDAEYEAQRSIARTSIGQA